jgi:Family of unknown function (DUF5335)
MAHEDTELPREDWNEYFDSFSRNLGAVKATVEVDGQDLGAQVVAEKLVLRGITYDYKDDVLVVGLVAAEREPSEDIQHFVYGPKRIVLDTTAIVPDTIDVEDSEGQRTLIELQAAPELAAE